ncbi:MAG: alanine/glycine:cation symporter family protein [Pseudohongiellaceae bacterium]
MEFFNDWLIILDGFLGGAAWFPALLLLTGLFFTFYLRFPQIRYFRHGMAVLRGRFDTEGAPGDISHFRALSTALSGTVGTGNIGGVAFALFLGGPAALFWMWLTAFLGMATKFVEVTLSHKYREQSADGTMAGGPMYYMEKRLNARWLATLFAIAAIATSFGMGNFPQINSIAAGMESSFAIDPLVTGSILTVLLALVIVGGIRRIAAVASRLVPGMALLYVLGALAVILPNMGNVIPSFVAIFRDVFTGSAAAGGFLGASMAYAFNRGVNRGLFSNEAGLGSAAIAHASARTREPVDEGMVSLLEPFIDTIVVCTITGLVILSSGVWTEKHHNTFARADLELLSGEYTDTVAADRQALFSYLVDADDSTVEPHSGELSLEDGRIADGQDVTVIHARSVAEDVRFLRAGEPVSGTLAVSGGQLTDGDVVVEGRSLLHSVPLTSMAFSRGWLGDLGPHIVSLGLLLFAFSTAIAWSYYGDRCVTYLLGSWAVLPYRLVYIGGFFFAALADTTVVWNIAAITMVLMAVPNLIGILLLRGEMRDAASDYWRRFSTRG